MTTDTEVAYMPVAIYTRDWKHQPIIGVDEHGKSLELVLSRVELEKLRLLIDYALEELP